MQTLFINGRVYAGSGAFCEAFLVQDGFFADTGTSQELLARYPDASCTDLHGTFVCPGFHDSHMHLLGLGSLLSNVDLSQRTHSLADVLAAMRERLSEMLSGEWLIGRGWNDDYFADEKRFPTREDLDAISTDVPILITRACGHISVANTRALACAGIDSHSADPDGGAIDRDAAGVPTGILRENAIYMVSGCIPLPDEKRVMDYLQRAAQEMGRLGITAVQSDDFSVFPALPYEVVMRAYDELEKQGRLTVRVYEQANLPTMERLQTFLNAGLRTGCGDDFFRIGPLKLISDGSLGAHTAYLKEPYADMPTTQGMPIFAQPQLNALVERAHCAGMQIAVHAIGDAALDQVLSALSRAQSICPREDARHGIVHAQITREDQLAEMQRQKLCAQVQPIFLDYDTHIVHSRVGEALAATSYAFHTLLQTCHASFGSDCPVEGANPLRGVQCAVTRAPLAQSECIYRPEEAFTVSEAIDAFTQNSAYTCFAENRLGRIEKGMVADFVLLAQSPFEAEPASIAQIAVLETWLQGNRVFSLAEA